MVIKNSAKHESSNSPVGRSKTGKENVAKMQLLLPPHLKGRNTMISGNNSMADAQLHSGSHLNYLDPGFRKSYTGSDAQSHLSG